MKIAITAPMASGMTTLTNKLLAIWIADLSREKTAPVNAYGEVSSTVLHIFSQLIL